MLESTLLSVSTEAIVLTLLLSLPSIIVASVVGVLVSLIQALTQVQEQTLAFAVKLITIGGVLYFSANWIGTELVLYTEQIFSHFSRLSKS